MRKAIIVSIAALAFVAGCQGGSNSGSNIPVQPKWKGAPYRIAFGAPAGKRSPGSFALPPITYTANPDALETRAALAIQFDASSVKRSGPVMNQMIMAPTDISGAQGALSADYVDTASKALSKMFAAYCMNGKIKMNVALVRSSISLTATTEQVNDKRLSDWLPIEMVFKNPHPKC